MDRPGAGLVILGVFGTAVAFPPPTLRLRHLWGLFALVILGLSVAVTIVGGVRLARLFPPTGTGRAKRIAVEIVGPVAAAAIISLYLVTIGRVALDSPIVLTPLVFAAAGGLGLSDLNDTNSLQGKIVLTILVLAAAGIAGWYAFYWSGHGGSPALLPASIVV